MSSSLMLPDRSTASIRSRPACGGVHQSPSCCGRAAATHNSAHASQASSADAARMRHAAACRRSRPGVRRRALSTRRAVLRAGGNSQRTSHGSGNASSSHGQANRRATAATQRAHASIQSRKRARATERRPSTSSADDVAAIAAIAQDARRRRRRTSAACKPRSRKPQPVVAQQLVRIWIDPARRAAQQFRHRRDLSRRRVARVRPCRRTGARLRATLRVRRQANHAAMQRERGNTSHDQPPSRRGRPPRRRRRLVDVAQHRARAILHHAAPAPVPAAAAMIARRIARQHVHAHAARRQVRQRGLDGRHEFMAPALALRGRRPGRVRRDVRDRNGSADGGGSRSSGSLSSSTITSLCIDNAGQRCGWHRGDAGGVGEQRSGANRAAAGVARDPAQRSGPHRRTGGAHTSAPAHRARAMRRAVPPPAAPALRVCCRAARRRDRRRAIAAHAAIAPARAACTDLKRTRVPKYSAGAVSATISVSRSRSAWNSLVWGLPLRAVSRQSMWRASSPIAYSRDSAYSMPRPRSGDKAWPLTPWRPRFGGRRPSARCA